MDDKRIKEIIALEFSDLTDNLWAELKNLLRAQEKGEGGKEEKEAEGKGEG